MHALCACVFRAVTTPNISFKPLSPQTNSLRMQAIVNSSKKKPRSHSSSHCARACDCLHANGGSRRRLRHISAASWPPRRRHVYRAAPEGPSVPRAATRERVDRGTVPQPSHREKKTRRLLLLLQPSCLPNRRSYRCGNRCRRWHHAGHVVLYFQPLGSQVYCLPCGR